jgi:actin-related protein
MTEEVKDVQTKTQEKPSDKELNFRMLEAKYEKQLAEERTARIEAERIVEDRKKSTLHDDDDDDEPYVDAKKLNRKLQRFGEQAQKQTQTEIQRAVFMALQEERKSSWIKQNADFYDVLQKHAETLAVRAPDLAETILDMPEGFERQKLVYKNIKALGLDKPEQKQSSIQEKIDANRRSPYYQPSGVGSAPYASVGDFSPIGQKQAYEKLQELKRNLRI